MDLSPDTIRESILFLIALVLSVTVHEFGHAWAATKLGDPLPRAQGRLTLSPRAHIDPIGTLLFPLIMSFSGIPLLGWGRPVQTNPGNYTRRISRPLGSAIVSVAGPAMNLLMAFVVSVLLVVAVRTGLMQTHLANTIIRHLVALNLTLMFFNLLPIPPLDGGAVLAWVLPRSMQPLVDLLNRWGYLLLLAVVMIPGVLPVVMGPAYYLSARWVQVMAGAAGG